MCILTKMLMFLIGLTITIMFYIFLEKKITSRIQNKIGFKGLSLNGLQLIADLIKLLCKSFTVPQNANKFLFIFCPAMMVIIGLFSWAVVPISNLVVFSNLNLGLLYLLTIGSIGRLLCMVTGWSLNSNYALLGAIRVGSQIIASAIPMTLVLIGILMKTTSMNLSSIVSYQQGGIMHWLCWPLFPLLIIYLIVIMINSDLLPFDAANCNAELVGGFQLEYSGIGLGLVYFNEYSKLILGAVLTVIMFFGGWLSPFVEQLLWVPCWCWFILKVILVKTLFILVGSIFPRSRVDQIIKLCWKRLIPLGLFWIVIEAIWIHFYGI